MRQLLRFCQLPERNSAEGESSVRLVLTEAEATVIELTGPKIRKRTVHLMVARTQGEGQWIEGIKEEQGKEREKTR